MRGALMPSLWSKTMSVHTELTAFLLLFSRQKGLFNIIVYNRVCSLSSGAM